MGYEQEIQKDNLLKVDSTRKSNINKIVSPLEKVICQFNNVLHKISSLFLFLLMFLTVGDVVGRYIFNKSITGTYELTGLVLALIIFFSLGTTQIYKGHVEIDFFTNKMSLKKQEILATITSFILFVLTALITWQLFEYTKRIWAGNELSGDLGIPLFIFTFLAMVGALSFTLTYLLESIQAFYKVVEKNEP